MKVEVAEAVAPEVASGCCKTGGSASGRSLQSSSLVVAAGVSVAGICSSAG